MKPAARKERFEAIAKIGCLLCIINLRSRRFLATGLPVERHHLNEDGKAGNRRRGDEETVGGCTWHHRAAGVPAADRETGITVEQMAEKYGPSLAQGSKRFHAEYPNDAALLSMQDELIGTGEVEYVD